VYHRDRVNAQFFALTQLASAKDSVWNCAAPDHLSLEAQSGLHRAAAVQ
jgi:hypothetical protein